MLREALMEELNYKGYKYYSEYVPNSKQLYSPLFIIGGALQKLGSFKPFIKYFSNYSSVICIDAPGSGDSDVVPASYDLDFIAGSIKDTMDHYGLERINLCGVSYGTPIAFHFAQKNPLLIESLVLIGIMQKISDMIEKKIQGTIDTIVHGNMDEFHEQLCSALLFKDNAIPRQELTVKLLKRGVNKLSRKDKEKYLENSKRLLLHRNIDLSKQISAKTLIFTGEKDPFTKPEYCKEVADSIPHSVFTTIKNADHLVNIEQFDTVCELLNTFLMGNNFSSFSNCNEIVVNQGWC